jgi:hypothetical protein
VLVNVIQVTNENKVEYANLAARHAMTTSIKEAVEAFQQGLWEIVPLDMLRIFSHAELELLISGLPDIDVGDLRRNTVYGSGLAASDRIVQWFWSIVEDMDREDVALLVQFVTGMHVLQDISLNCTHADVAMALHTLYVALQHVAMAKIKACCVQGLQRCRWVDLGACMVSLESRNSRFTRVTAGLKGYQQRILASISWTCISMSRKSN